MSLSPAIRRWRDWVPTPTEDEGFEIVRWVLIDANRLAVTGSLLTGVFISFLLLGTVWTFEMQRLLTETSTVQTILDTLLSGMILLVSIVVSINSIVLSHDMSSVDNQEERVEGVTKFRRQLGQLAEPGENPSNPTSFLKLMSRTIRERAERLHDSTEGTTGEPTEEVRERASVIATNGGELGVLDQTTGAEFAVLWKGMEFDYGEQMELLRQLKSNGDGDCPEVVVDRIDSLLEVLELFAIGKEYFKTLYYTQDVSRLSQTLLVITLPAILINASTILAINAGLLPDFWLLGLPPLQTFVAASFTISLAPYLVLTAYMLRLSAVARLTSSAGIFTLGTSQVFGPGAK